MLIDLTLPLDLRTLYPGDPAPLIEPAATIEHDGVFIHNARVQTPARVIAEC